MPRLIPSVPYYAALMWITLLLKAPEVVKAFHVSTSSVRWSPSCSNHHLVAGSSSRRQTPICSLSSKGGSTTSNKKKNQSGTSSSTTTPRPFWKQYPSALPPPASSAAPLKASFSNINDDNHDDNDTGLDAQTFLYGTGAVVAAAGLTYAHSTGVSVSPQDVYHAAERFLQNPQDTLQEVVEMVQAMGPAAPLYFGVIYLIAEILAVPATPLTLSAGYLFGLTQGTAIVLVAASIAASISFFVGKTFLRSWVESVLEENPKFAKIDRAIAKEGFQLLFLVRLSPIFPFALSNYLYGASAIDFGSYFWATLFGFTPGTVAAVYTGMVGKALTYGEGEPWYVYAGGFGAMLVFLKLVTDVATNIVESLDEDDQ
jgi:uncharacterized membrane protein YdjX (TVP38/TMEM64 family)